MYSVDSVELRSASSEDTVDTVTVRGTRTDFARAHPQTVTSELPVESATTSSSSSSVTSSSKSIMIGHTEQMPAASETEIVDATQAADSGPRITTASDGSVVLTLSYSPLKLQTVNRNAAAAADTVVISRTPDRQSDSRVHSSAVTASPAKNGTENLLAQGFVASFFSFAVGLLISIFFIII